jgi:hypothetical protein
MEPPALRTRMAVLLTYCVALNATTGEQCARFVGHRGDHFSPWRNDYTRRVWHP